MHAFPAFTCFLNKISSKFLSDQWTYNMARLSHTKWLFFTTTITKNCSSFPSTVFHSNLLSSDHFHNDVIRNWFLCHSLTDFSTCLTILYQEKLFYLSDIYMFSHPDFKQYIIVFVFLQAQQPFLQESERLQGSKSNLVLHLSICNSSIDQ